MPYSRDSIPTNHSEFGGGAGPIDPVLRDDRVLTPEQELMEIYATNPASPGDAYAPPIGGVAPTEEQLAAAVGRVERENDPATADVERP